MTDLLAGMAIMAGLALALRARTAPARLRRASATLALFMALLGGELLLASHSPRGWEALLLPALPILLARHVEHLAAAGRGWRGDALAATSGALALPYLLLPDAALHQIEAGQLPALDPRAGLGLVAATGLYWLGLVAITSIAGLRILRAIRRHHALLRQFVAQPPTRRLSGVALLAGFLACAFGLQLLDLVSLGAILSEPAADLFALALVLGLGLHGLTLRPSWPDWAEALVTDPPLMPQTGPRAVGEPDPDADPDAGPPRYARSGLDAEGVAQLLGRLDLAMAREALWRRPDLTLADLAAAARAKPFYVGQALNQGRGESFFDYVNRLRISEAQARLTSSDASILEIAFEVGFNAKSTFNAAFRKGVGMTPSQWRASGPLGTDASPTPER